eukprot:5015540-Pyramimonas_sp.AAC.1
MRLFPARGVYLPPASLRLDWRPRDVQDGSKRASESARWPPGWSNIDCGRRVTLASDKPKRLQDGLETVSSALQGLQGPSQAAQLFKTPTENHAELPSCFFAD